jgi:hypothetical protein
MASPALSSVLATLQERYLASHSSELFFDPFDVASRPETCSYEHMRESNVIPQSVAGCLAEIERSVQRFRSCYDLGTDPKRMQTDEIITMRVELIRLWSEISSEQKGSAAG